MTTTALPRVTIPCRQDPDDRTLVDRARTGDAEAFGELWRIHQPDVLRYIRSRVGGQHLAEDLTSDVFVRALASINRWQWQGSTVGAWFVTIARNLVYDYFRSGRYRIEWTAPVGFMPPSGDATEMWDRADLTPEGDPANLAVANVTGGVLRAAMASLTEDQRRVLELRFIHGLPISDVAAILGRGQTAIKALQYRGSQALARHFAQMWGQS